MSKRQFSHTENVTKERQEMGQDRAWRASWRRRNRGPSAGFFVPQVLFDGEEGLPGSPLSQLDARLFCLPLLLPAL